MLCVCVFVAYISISPVPVCPENQPLLHAKCFIKSGFAFASSSSLAFCCKVSRFDFKHLGSGPHSVVTKSLALSVSLSMRRQVSIRLLKAFFTILLKP